MEWLSQFDLENGYIVCISGSVGGAVVLHTVCVCVCVCVDIVGAL